MKKSFLSVIAVLLVAVVLSTSACMHVKVEVSGGSLEDLIPTVGNETPSDSGNIYVPPVETTTAVNIPAETTTTASSETTTTAPVVTAKTPLEMTDAQLLEYFNNNLNNIKETSVGFKRSKLTTVSDIVLSNSVANTLVDFVKGALLSEEVEEKTVAKGESSMAVMSPKNQRYVSQLLSSEISNIDVKVEGTNYVVTVELPEAKNPTRDSGYYAKIFDFITVDDVVSTYAPKVGATVDRSNIGVKYSGCYAKATFSPDGRVVAYETYVKCVMSLKDASIKKVVTISTDVDITLVSTTKYTDFSY